MSLAKLLDAHDDAALEALASKGLVRRARRDLESGLAQVTQRTSTGATVTADGQTVAIDAKGLSHCRCTCPAGGICRHIVLAVMALRGVSPPAATTPTTATATATAPIAPTATAATAASDTPGTDSSISTGAPDPTPPTDASGSTASDDLKALGEATLRKFAGAAWQPAVALADSSADATIHEEGRNCRVDFVATAISVTFIAGQPLKAAAYKGPKTKARVVTAAAAILVRSRHGVGVESVEPAAAPEASISPEFLSAASKAVLRMVRSVLTGPSPLTIDTVFDLAISARAEAAPRLTAQLRALASDAGLAMKRDVNFEPARFVAAAANTVALIEGLGATPLDTALTGSLRRNYEAREGTLDLWMMAASCWRSETGARGITFHAFAPKERTWFSATIARGAGQDPMFDPRAAYRQPLWGAGQPEKWMARQVTLTSPLVADDRSIAITQKHHATVAAPLRKMSDLIEAGAAHTRWGELCADLAQRVGAGLRRRAQPLPAILCPAQFRGFTFDEIAQVYELEVIDVEGAALILTLPAEADHLAERLRREGNHLRFVCAEATLAKGEPLLRPVAIGLETAGELKVVNLDLDHWQQQGVALAVFNRLRDALSTPRGPKPMVDPLRKIALRSLEAATSAASAAPAIDAKELVADCEAAGLLTLARSLEAVMAKPDVLGALRAAYLASEIEAAAAWA